MLAIRPTSQAAVHTAIAIEYGNPHELVIGGRARRSRAHPTRESRDAGLDT